MILQWHIIIDGRQVAVGRRGIFAKPVRSKKEREKEKTFIRPRIGGKYLLRRDTSERKRIYSNHMDIACFFVKPILSGKSYI